MSRPFETTSTDASSFAQDHGISLRQNDDSCAKAQPGRMCRDMTECYRGVEKWSLWFARRGRHSRIGKYDVFARPDRLNPSLFSTNCNPDHGVDIAADPEINSEETDFQGHSSYVLPAPLSPAYRLPQQESQGACSCSNDRKARRETVTDNDCLGQTRAGSPRAAGCDEGHQRSVIAVTASGTARSVKFAATVYVACDCRIAS